jgi:hypothetical protein
MAQLNQSIYPFFRGWWIFPVRFLLTFTRPGISWDCFYHDQLGVCTTSDHIIRTCPSHAEVLLVFSKLALEK